MPDVCHHFCGMNVGKAPGSQFPISCAINRAWHHDTRILSRATPDVIAGIRASPIEQLHIRRVHLSKASRTSRARFSGSRRLTYRKYFAGSRPSRSAHRASSPSRVSAYAINTNRLHVRDSKEIVSASVTNLFGNTVEEIFGHVIPARAYDSISFRFRSMPSTLSGRNAVIRGRSVKLHSPHCSKERLTHKVPPNAR